MSKAWPELPLADIAKPIARPVAVIPGRDYRTIGVKWWGEGAYERQTIDGSSTAAKTLSLVRQGDLIINKIWVRHGSAAIAGADVDGCAGSGEFPTFNLDESRVVPRWLHWQTKTRGFWAKCDALSQGTSGKNRIKPELFLTIRVPLPPLVEQQRVVARIEELAAQIHEARTLRHQAAEEADALIASALEKMFPKDDQDAAQYQPVRKVIKGHKQGYYAPGKLREGKILYARITDITDSGYLNYSGMPRVAVDDTALEAFRVEPNDFLFARTGGAGRFALARESVDCVFASYLIRFTFGSDYSPEFLRFYFRSPRFQSAIGARIHGGVNQNVHAEDIKDATVPIIPMEQQRRIVAELDALQSEVDALKRLQAETATELDALLPSILDKAFKGEL